ncbi:hypothetical protein HF086_008308 [Spodoptera exigua]|uniref:FP protein C-terminal domain-containing protein n=1 Tax=Spodoptera exigua TaxID=7107 RepID=A0A922SH25_SPOEX|nr:hypothetical protein HF086_008308 [Spodoptera exigua]
MSNKYDEFLNKITQLESARREDKKNIEYLEEKVEYLERKSKSTGIEIRNVPKKSGETKSDLCKIVESIAKTVSVDMGQNCIKDIYRIKSKDSSKPIIAEFTTVLIKEKVLGNVKIFNKSKIPSKKLNSTHLGLQGQLYLAETLTTKAQKLFYLARNFQKQYNYDFCWTSHGVIYLRKKGESPHIKIISEMDIEQLRKSE